jgi:putative redox protein
MSTISILYTGGLHSECTHNQSRTVITADAPLDNHGTGASFSPTDLLCNALATCMISIIGIASKTHNFDVVGTKLEVTKIMESNPRKVGEIIVEIYFPEYDYSEKNKSIIEKSALTCPVYLSLHPEVKKTVHFHYK